LAARPTKTSSPWRWAPRRTKSANWSLPSSARFSLCLEDRSDNDPLRNLQKKEVTEVVRKMLDKTELLVITLYYYEQLNLREIGELLSLTESRICQIHTKVVQRLKKKLA